MTVAADAVTIAREGPPADWEALTAGADPLTIPGNPLSAAPERTDIRLETTDIRSRMSDQSSLRAVSAMVNNPNGDGRSGLGLSVLFLIDCDGGGS
jgi:hypothetical protein